MQFASNSAAKRMQRPALAELSERPTPRKLAVSQSPVSTRYASSQRESRPSKSPKKLAIRGNPTRLDVQRADQRSASDGGIANGVHRSPAKRRSVTIGAEETITIVPNGVPVQLSTTPKRPVPERRPMKRNVQSERPISDVASSIASGSQKLSHINGMVHQLNGTNGTSVSSHPSSVADTSEELNKRAPPPKLKRKAPG